MPADLNRRSAVPVPAGAGDSPAHVGLADQHQLRLAPARAAEQVTAQGHREAGGATLISHPDDGSR